MTALTIHARELFDGHRWHEAVRVTLDGDRVTGLEPAADPAPGDELVACVVPGLVDAGAVAAGYTERPTDDPFRPERAFALLCLRYGVTTVFDLGSPLAVAAYLGGTGPPGPRHLHSGGRLVGRARTRNDVVVDATTVDAVVGSLVTAGGAVLAVGPIDDPRTEGAVVRCARDHGRPVVWSARTGAVDLPGWIWAAERPSTGALGFTGPLDDGLPVAPELEASARYTVDGLIDATDAWVAAPVLPYARHFAQSKGRFGRRIARQVLEPMYGDRDGDDLGPARTTEAARAARTGHCLTASGAGRAGLVPGLSLWAEARRIADLSDDRAGLHAATGAADRLGVVPGTGTIRPGGPADVLLLDARPDAGGHLDHTALTDVLVAGRRHAVSELAGEIDELTRRTFAESS